MMMGNGGGGDGGENSGATLECDVGLGLKMQSSSSSSNHESCLPPLTNKMPLHPYNHHSFMDMGGGGGGGSDSGGYGYTSGCGSHGSGVYYDSVAAAAPPPPSPLQTTNLLQSSSSSSGGGGGMAKWNENGVFTANQWQELERQTNIYKYMMAKIPLPPNLLRISSTPLLPTSKSNIGGGGGLDLRFSSGCDPEPWRCRRTDGKKWRCSRDVTPDHKYCDRHAHKNRPRSRKPVEQLPINSHTTTTTATAGNLKNNYTHHPSILSPTTFHNPLSQLPNMVSATTPHELDQPRWFNKNGGSGTTSTNQQFRQVMQSSPGGLGTGIGSKRDRNVSVFQQNYEADDPAGRSASAATRQQQHLTGNINGNECLLSLSMQSGGNIGIEEDDQNYPMGGMIDQERGGHTPWMGSGGPLGEALCLGIASRRGSSNSSSPCEDGLNFI